MEQRAMCCHALPAGLGHQHAVHQWRHTKAPGTHWNLAQRREVRALSPRRLDQHNSSSWLWERSAVQRSEVHMVQTGERETEVRHELDAPSSQHELDAPSSSKSSPQPSTSSNSSNSEMSFDDSILKSLDEEMSQPDDGSPSSVSSPLLAALPVVGIGLLLGVGFLLKDQIKDFLDFFIAAVEEWGVWGYFAFAATYTGLEVLAVPAVPLTMAAGVVFGPIPGTAIVSASGTLAAIVAFLIARYAARDKILQMAKRNRRFAAIDRAIGRDGFKFTLLLRLSPLFPFAASNYLYGLTSVDLAPYVAGTFLGSLPGTYAYVSAGHIGKAVLKGGEGSLSVEVWQVALGMTVTVLALGFIGQLAKQAIEEDEDPPAGGPAPPS